MKLKNILFAGIFAFTLFTRCSSGSEQSQNSDSTTARTGIQIYEKYCTNCHGAKGDLGLSGAKDLSQSSLSAPLIIQQVKFGKGAMVPYEGILSAEEIQQVADYTLSLQK